MKSLTTQRGSTLVVTLIFLVLMSLFAISAFNSTSSNLRIVGNMQARQEASSAADAAIESVITSVSQSLNNGTLAEDIVQLKRSPINIDINGDGTSDYSVNAPGLECFRKMDHKPAIDIPKEGLPPGHPELSCMNSSAPCLDTDWDFSATVLDNRTNTAVTVHQGMTITTFPGEDEAVCPS